MHPVPDCWPKATGKSFLGGQKRVADWRAKGHFKSQTVDLKCRAQILGPFFSILLSLCVRRGFMLEFQLGYQNEGASYGPGRRDTVLASGRGVQALNEEKTDAVVWSDIVATKI